MLSGALGQLRLRVDEERPHSCPQTTPGASGGTQHLPLLPWPLPGVPRAPGTRRRGGFCAAEGLPRGGAADYQFSRFRRLNLSKGNVLSRVRGWGHWARLMLACWASAVALAVTLTLGGGSCPRAQWTCGVPVPVCVEGTLDPSHGQSWGGVGKGGMGVAVVPRGCSAVRSPLGRPSPSSLA